MKLDSDQHLHAYGYRVKGLAHLLNNEWQPTIDAMMKAIDLRDALQRIPANAMEWYPLAIAYARLDNADEAQTLVRQGGGLDVVG